MITANEALAKVRELIQKDADAIDAQCNEFIENVVQAKVLKAVEDRQCCCGVDIPAELASVVQIISSKLRELGYKTAVANGYQKHLTIGWN